MSRSKRRAGSELTTAGPFARARAPYRAKIEYRQIGDIRPNPRNARTHSKKQIRQIARSMKQFGFTNPVIIDEHGMVLAGHGRLEAARLLGFTEVPVIEISHLSDAEKRAYVIADNKIALNAGWDAELLALELGELAVLLPQIDLDLDISITGFSTPELDGLFGDHVVDQGDPSDKADLPHGPVVSRRGDVWQMGRTKHRLICEDARLATTMEWLRGGEVVAMVITDPPYNVRINGHVGGRGKTRHNEFAFASGEMSPDEYRAFLTGSVRQMVDTCAPGALTYIFIDWRHAEVLLAVCRSLGLALRNICVWNKTSPGQGSFYRSAHELIVVCQVPGGEATNNIELGRHGRTRTNVWTFPGVNTFKVGENDDYALHPTVKPIALIAEAIKDASPRGGIILDPFLGSGTTLLACEKVGRRCFGVEYEPGYVDVAIRRWQQFTGQDAYLVGVANDDASAALVGLTYGEVGSRRSDLDLGHESDPPRPFSDSDDRDSNAQSSHTGVQQ